jgi:hypothetical protein
VQVAWDQRRESGVNHHNLAGRWTRLLPDRQSITEDKGKTTELFLILRDPIEITGAGGSGNWFVFALNVSRFPSES